MKTRSASQQQPQGIVDDPTKAQCLATLKREWGLKAINDAVPMSLWDSSGWTPEWFRALDTLCRAMEQEPAVELMQHAKETSGQESLIIEDLEEAMKADATVSASVAYRQRYAKPDSKAARAARAAKRGHREADATGADDVPGSPKPKRRKSAAKTGAGADEGDLAGAGDELQDEDARNEGEASLNEVPEAGEGREEKNDAIEQHDPREHDDTTIALADSDLVGAHGGQVEATKPTVYRIGPSKASEYLGRTIDWHDDDDEFEATTCDNIRNELYASAPVFGTRQVYAKIDSVSKLRDWDLERGAHEPSGYDKTDKQLNHLLTEVNDLMKARDFIESTNRKSIREIDEAEAEFIAGIADAKVTYALKLKELGFLPQTADWPKYTSTEPSRYEAERDAEDDEGSSRGRGQMRQIE